jgi:hypothetical protein
MIVRVSIAASIEQPAGGNVASPSLVTKRYISGLAGNITAKDRGEIGPHAAAGLVPARPRKREYPMKPILASLSLATVLALTGASGANAWVRSGSVTTWRGTYYGSASGGCAGGTCSRSASVTGPYGGTIARSGSITRVGPHAFDYTRTTTGPNGNSVTRSGTVVTHPYYGYRY